MDPEEMNLKRVYDALLDFYEVHNTNMLEDDDAVAVIMDYWIDYGLVSLNERLQLKYGHTINNVTDPYSGGVIPRKNATKKGWPYPPNHFKYEDPLKMKPVPYQGKMPAPQTPPPKNRKKQQRPQSTTRNNNNKRPESSNRRGPKERRPQSTTRGAGDNRPQSTTRGKKNNGPRRQDNGARPQSTTRKQGNGQRPQSTTRNQAQGNGGRKNGPRGNNKGRRNNNPNGDRKSTNRDGGEFRKSKHHAGNRKVLNSPRPNMVSMAPKKSPDKRVKKFQSLEDFDAPVSVSTVDVLEAFYARNNEVVLNSSIGVSALLRWIETHSIEEFDVNLKKKYNGASLQDPGIQRDAVRRRNMEILLSVDDKVKRAELVQVINKAMKDGVQVIRQYQKKHAEKT